MNDPGEITRLLVQVREGEEAAFQQLFPLVYAELRNRAERFFREQSPGHTLQATALVHEAYMRLVNQQEGGWQDRAHFFAVSARAMRHILVDHARSRQRIKRGGDQQRVPLEEGLIVGGDSEVDLVDLDVALDKLDELDARLARVVELRFFAGMTVEEAAEILGVGPATVKRDWSLARTWLLRELTSTQDRPPGPP